MSILDHVPEGYTLREVQRNTLLELEENWNEYDVFVVEAPVASGKSLMSVILTDWLNKRGTTSAILTPKSMLQDQYQRDFPQIPSLKGKSKYPCHNQDYKNCGEFYDAAGFYCKEQCRYKCALGEAQEASNVILNFHSHLFSGMVHNMYKDTLVIDEAHNLVPMLSDVYTLRIWKHKEDYPYNTYTKDDIVEWLSEQITELDSNIKRVRAIYKDSIPTRIRKTLLKDTRKYMKYKMIKSGLIMPQELFNIALTSKPYGRPIKGKVNMKECVEVKPISLKTVPHQMWPDGEVKKVVMMSATIYDKDIERLGIKRKRVKHIYCNSPINKDNRPVFVIPVASMSYRNIKESSKIMCSKIKEIEKEHGGKGIVHITYGLAKEFKKHLKGRRYMWHTELTREDTYKKFLESKDNKILMACGMGEGIDLVGEDYEWQVVAKTMFPSLADPLNQHFVQKDPIVYTLEAVRSTVQQSGRICRTPSDFGVTYILDANFARLYKRNYKLFPDYFIESMIWGKS